jgi:hypothetical protein
MTTHYPEHLFFPIQLASNEKANQISEKPRGINSRPPSQFIIRFAERAGQA